MKIRITVAIAATMAVAICLVIASCTKDTGFSVTKIYTPVYKSAAEVRASIKTEAPQAVSSAGKMLLLGNYIFLNEINKGVHIIDNSNPAAPINKAFIAIPGNLDMQVKGNALYADSYTDLLVLDISNLQNVSCKTYLHNIFPDRIYLMGMYIPDGQVVVDWRVRDTTATLGVAPGQGIWKNHEYYYNGPWVVPGIIWNDQTYSAASSSGKSGTGVTGSTSRMAIINNHLYAAASNVLSAININSPLTPQLEQTSGAGLVESSAQTIFALHNKLFIGGSNGISIFSVDNASAPVYETGFGHFCSSDPVIADDSTAYVTLHTGNWCGGTIDELDVLDISDLKAVKSIHNYPMTGPEGLSKDGNLLFICDGSELKIFDATTPANIKQLNTISLTDVYDVICYNKIAYVSAKGGIYQYDYSNINAIRKLGTISLSK